MCGVVLRCRKKELGRRAAHHHPPPHAGHTEVARVRGQQAGQEDVNTRASRAAGLESVAQFISSSTNCTTRDPREPSGHRRVAIIWYWKLPEV